MRSFPTVPQHFDLPSLPRQRPSSPSHRMNPRQKKCVVAIGACLSLAALGGHAQIAINAGGPAAGGFVADTYATGGTAYANATATTAFVTTGLTNPAPAAAYADERYGNFSYNIPGLTPGALYRVRLHFVETYWSAAGKRIFNVSLNGTPSLTNFDIYANTGAKNKVTIKEFNVAASTSGTIAIQFASVVDNAKVDAIEVIPVKPISINAGGPATGSFIGDTYATGGTTAANATTSTPFDTTGVVSPAPTAAYVDERYGNFTYTVPNLAPATSYRVRLHFVETYWNAAGQRVFNVTINGAPALTNFDIYAAAGAKNKVVIREFSVPASSTGTIAIQFASVVNSAKVDAIEIIPPGTATATTTPPTTTVLVPVAPAIANATASNGGDTLSWGAVSNATGYNVKRSTTNGGPYTVVSNNQAGTNFTDTGLTNGSTYYYVVSAVNSAGESSNSPAVSVVPIAPVTATPTGNQTGINIAGTSDWMPDRLYADLVRTARSFMAPNTNGNGPSTVPVDSNGWPTTDFSFLVWAGLDQMQGTYALAFQGQASVTGPNGNIPLTYDAASNTSSGTFQYTNAASSSVFLNFSGTRRTASSASGTGVTGIQVMRPITPGATQPHPYSELFNRAAKAEIAKFQAIRFMDYLGTNSSAQTNWSDRPLPGWASFNRNPGNAYGWVGIGGPLEHVIRLANETGKDVWLNVPARATDDYVRKTAQLFAFGSDGVNPYTAPQANPVYPPLNPGLKLYVEYSNELWNTSSAFRQSADNCQAASNELSSTGGNSPLNFDKSWNGVTWTAGGAGFDWNKCWRRIAKRGAEISTIFRSVYGDQAMMTTVRPVLMSQLGYAGGPLFAGVQMMLGYYDNFGGNFVATPRPPNYYFYGAGGSAYYGPAVGDTTVDQIFADPGMNPSGFTPQLQADMALVSALGLKRVAYEGGPSLDRTGGARDAASALAVNDPRMTTAVVNQHNAWTANGGELLTYYQAVGDYQWGFTSTPYNLNTPKLAAIDQLRTAPKAALSYGTPIPGSVSGTAPGACSRNWGCSPLNPASFSSSGSGVTWASYTFRAPSAGTRSVTLNFSSGTSAQVAVYVDGALVGSQTTSGAPLIFSPGSLDAGLHGVIVRALSGSFTLSSVAVQ